MGKSRLITTKDIEGALEILNTFGIVDVSNLPRYRQEELIRLRYGETVRGKPVSEMRDAQLYMVAQSVYSRATRIVRQLEEGKLEQSLS